MRNKLVGLSVSLLVAACGGGGGGSDTSESRVTTQSVPPPTTVQFTASSNDVLRGNAVTLNWSSTNATSCSASGDWSGSKSTSGSESVVASKDSNTFTINCNGVTVNVTVNADLFKTTFTTSDLPDYTNSLVSKDDLVKGLNRAVSSTTFITGRDGKMRVFMFPSYFYNGPELPAFELTEHEKGKFKLVKFYNDMRLGFARDSKLLNTKTATQFVVVDQGLENNKDYSLWPHGDVWVATDSGSGFTFSKISPNRAFYHSVAVADISGDNKDDILVVNMGSNDKNAYPYMLYAFNQTTNGNFILDNKFAPETFAHGKETIGSGAVASVDLDGDGTVEVIQANYSSVHSIWGAFRISKRDITTGAYKVTKTYQREGNYTYMGAYNVQPVDIDNDNDKDLIFVLEGNPSGNGTSTHEALEIYRNDGNLVFTRMTDVWLTKSLWNQGNTDPINDFYWREISIIDIDNDGYLDIFLQQGGFNHYLVDPNVDLGRFILKNNKGTGFKTMQGTKGLTVNFQNKASIPDSFRVMDKQGNTTRIFGFSPSGVPTVIDLNAGK